MEYQIANEDGKNTGCGPASPDNFNYGEEHRSGDKSANTQDDGVNQAANQQDEKNAGCV